MITYRHPMKLVSYGGLAFCRLLAWAPATIVNHSSLCDTSSSSSMPPTKASKASSNKSKSPALVARQQQQQKKSSSKDPPKESKSKGVKVTKAELPIHFDPEESPECSTCVQKFGSHDKDALPKQIPLKWRTFNVKSIGQDKALHFYTRLLEAPP